jgi:hypothetical protein
MGYPTGNIGLTFDRALVSRNGRAVAPNIEAEWIRFGIRARHLQPVQRARKETVTSPPLL